MSENKFTPGPLTARKSQGIFRDCIVDASGEAIAIFKHYKNHHDLDLFAASPELLEVAEALLEWIDSVPEDTVLTTMPGCDREWIDSVIEKAKGKYYE